MTIAYFKPPPPKLASPHRSSTAGYFPQPFAQDRGDDRLRLYSASSSRRYSIPAGVKAIVCCARAIDPEAAVLRLHLVNHLPQATLVLAKDFSGVTDGDCGSRRRHIRQRGQQPSRGANSTVIGRPIQ